MSMSDQQRDVQPNQIHPIYQKTPISWLVRIGSLLLLGETAGLSAIIIYYVSQSGWIFDNLYGEELNIAVFGVVLIPLILLTFIAAVAMLFIRRSSWIFAMLVQGLILYVCIDFYFSSEDPFWALYPVMIYAILMVLYLDSFIVRTAFYPQTSTS